MRTAEQILRDIIADVNAMRCDITSPTGCDLFGPFDGIWDCKASIEWPNLDLLVKEAETALKGTHEKEDQKEIPDGERHQRRD